MSERIEAARSFGDRKARHDPVCPRCNLRPKSVELIVQARSTKRPKPGALASRAKRLCEPCALQLFEAIERIIDNPFNRPPGYAGLDYEPGKRVRHG